MLELNVEMSRTIAADTYPVTVVGIGANGKRMFVDVGMFFMYPKAARGNISAVAALMRRNSATTRRWQYDIRGVSLAPCSVVSSATGGATGRAGGNGGMFTAWHTKRRAVSNI